MYLRPMKTLNVQRLKDYKTETGVLDVSKEMFFSVDDGESTFVFFITAEGDLMVDYGDCSKEFVSDTLPHLEDLIVDTYKNFVSLNS